MSVARLELTVSCDYPGCRERITKTGQSWQEAVRKIIEAGWTYRTGRPNHCPEHFYSRPPREDTFIPSGRIVFDLRHKQ